VRQIGIVQIFHSVQNFSRSKRNLILVESSSLKEIIYTQKKPSKFHDSYFARIAQSSSLQKLHRNPNFFGQHKRVEILHNVRMTKLVQKVNFAKIRLLFLKKQKKKKKQNKKQKQRN
jgi:hypothetical protein